MTFADQQLYNKLLDTGRRRELYPDEKDMLKILAELRVQELYNRGKPHYEWDIEKLKEMGKKHIL